MIIIIPNQKYFNQPIRWHLVSILRSHPKADTHVQYWFSTKNSMQLESFLNHVLSAASMMSTFSCNWQLHLITAETTNGGGFPTTSTCSNSWSGRSPEKMVPHHLATDCQHSGWLCIWAYYVPKCEQPTQLSGAVYHSMINFIFILSYRKSSDITQYNHRKANCTKLY